MTTAVWTRAVKRPLLVGLTALVVACGGEPGAQSTGDFDVVILNGRVMDPETEFDAVTNVGSRPTFPDGGQKVVESHLFDFDGEIYGEGVELGFLERLRGEQAFASAEALASQIEIDAGRAREYLQQENCFQFVPTIGE